MFLNLVVLSSTPWPVHLSPRWGRVALLSHETHTSAPEKEKMMVTLFYNSNFKFLTSDQFLCLLIVLAGLHGLLHLEHHTVPAHGCNEQGGIFPGKMGRIFQLSFGDSQEMLVKNHAHFHSLV